MKINKTHFKHTDQVNTQQRSKSTTFFLKSYEYGLGRIQGCGHKDFIVIEDNLLIVNSIQAITIAGHLIEIEKGDKVQFSLSTFNSNIAMEPELTYAVILKINVGDYVEKGIPDPAELPPRFPFRKVSYSLSVIPEKDKGLDHNNAYSICVARLIPDHNRLKLEEGFIPAAMSVVSHDILAEQYMRIERILEEILKNATVVVINAKSKKKHGEINDLATNTFYLMEKMVFYLAENMSKIKTIYKEQSPIHIFLFLNSFARVVLSALACIKSADKEALLRYFESHLGFKPHQFESEIKSLSQLKYRHYEIQECMEESFMYLETLRAYVSKSINLEYHSAERVDVINETVITKRKLDIF